MKKEVRIIAQKAKIAEIERVISLLSDQLDHLIQKRTQLLKELDKIEEETT
ncbi:MAG: hypothetical protein ACK528_09335 [Alphaproteobacteria bacterium]